eukprot:CCRYP_004962-RA/>CCRYP_004962-RA protein AED:0.20 eAED:0.20 QI:505/0.5/0.33/1/1/1/3/0/382
MSLSYIETKVEYKYIKFKNKFFLRYSKSFRVIMSASRGGKEDESGVRDGSLERTGGLNSDEKEGEEEEARLLLPTYLYPVVRFYCEDFYVSHRFDPTLIVQLIAEGFLPIATSGILLPKLHVERCVLQLRPTCKLHTSKATRKKAKNFSLTINQCFDRVVAGCHAQHGTNWLYPPIVNAFREINRRTIETNGHGADAFLVDSKSNERCGTTQVRLYSVEVWSAESGDLVAGELGHSVGGIYTSLTGFSSQDSAGSVQLLALGKLLKQCGFDYWDLGMEMEYKIKLGAELMRRADFVREVHRTRVQRKHIVLRCTGRRNARELIDWDRVSVTRCGSSGEALKDASLKHDGTDCPDQSSDDKRCKKRVHEDDDVGSEEMTSFSA